MKKVEVISEVKTIIDPSMVPCHDWSDLREVGPPDFKLYPYPSVNRQ